MNDGKVNCCDLEKNQSYILTHDFYPYGGTIVKLIKRVPAKQIWRGHRGDAAIVGAEFVGEFAIHPKAYLFSCDEGKRQ